MVPLLLYIVHGDCENIDDTKKSIPQIISEQSGNRKIINY